MMLPAVTAAALVGLAIGAVTGLQLNNAPLQKELAACQAESSSRIQQSQTAARVRLEDALRAHDAATKTLQTSRQRLAAQLEKTRHDLQNTTTSRACLGADAISVLQRSPAFAPVDAALPTPAQQPAGAGSAIATDTDIAGWAATAASQFDACRARISAIGQWDAQVNGR